MELVGAEKHEAAKSYIEAQDRKIEEASGKARGLIKAVFPVGDPPRREKPLLPERQDS